jgi:hypothetical protein
VLPFVTVLRRLWCVLVFLVLTAEYPHLFEKHWSTPWHYIQDVLFAGIPFIHVPWLDVFIVAILVAGRSQSGASSGRARPVETAMWLSLGSLALWAIYGALASGSISDMRLQLHIIVMVFVAAFAQLNIMRKPEHFRMIAKAIVYAGLFRFAMIFVFYIAIMRSLREHMEEVTDHGDSVLFVTCIVIVVANAFHVRSRRSIVRAVVISILMAWCMQMNARRLAWVGLVFSLGTMYALLRTGPVRRKVHRLALYAAPVLALYVAIGWSHPKGIFKPIASLQSVGDAKNPSTQSRILEDMGLIITLQGHPLIGTGFGHKYIEISEIYSVGAKVFPQYRYVPHNSVLGLVAFTGALGFIGIWMVFPVTAYFGARTYAVAATPLEKTIAMTSVCVVIIHTNQMWGDIGINAPQGMIIMSAAIAASSRMAVWCGVWPSGARAAQKRQGKVVTVIESEAIAEEMTSAPS